MELQSKKKNSAEVNLKQALDWKRCQIKNATHSNTTHTSSGVKLKSTAEIYYKMQTSHGPTCLLKKNTR